MVDRLTALALTGEPAKQRNDAVALLNQAIASNSWTAAGQLRPVIGEKDANTIRKEVFERLRNAAEKLEKIPNNPPVDRANVELASLVRRWAADAIGAAVGRNVKPKVISDARKKVAQGDKKLLEGKAKEAIDKYGDAWVMAVKA